MRHVRHNLHGQAEETQIKTWIPRILINSVYQAQGRYFRICMNTGDTEGPFEFQLNLTIDRENAQVVTVDERNETGAG